VSDYDTSPELQFLSTPELAKLLHISPAALRQRLKRGTAPPAKKMGGRCAWSVATVRAWFEALPSRGGCQVRPTT
jgi:predicted DNA-binding transcriptional regulator AlpA